MPSTVLKDPDAVLDYKFDWKASTNGTGDSDWLASGETISSRTVTVQTGLTKDSDSLTDTNTSVTVWLSGGADDTDYTVECEIVTSASRTDQRTMIVQVRER
jgi:hypothetical protein